jgi:flavin-dependent thymidylate synthase
MRINLLYFTGKDTDDETWYAARLLAFSKNTRLQLNPDGYQKFATMPIDELGRELEYMATTIASSWELIDLVFVINGISRACAQQITRTRQASYAMQSQRVTDMRKADAYVPPSVTKDNLTRYQLALSNGLSSYEQLVRSGVSLEDARGVLPMNIHCNLLAKYNFRAWVDLVRSRDSLRVQGEYTEIIHMMKQEVFRVWPWAKTFVQPKQQQAINLLEEVAQELPPETRTRLAKVADLLKKDTT